MENREIKFRVFDDGKMIYQNQIQQNTINKHDYNHLSWFFDTIRKDSILMQYTGLKDKNGKEIYEGDIVKSEQWNPQIYQVGFNRGGFCFYQNENDSYYNDCKYLEKFEVIGNICKNAGLLAVAP